MKANIHGQGHQNKFHIEEVKALTKKYSEMDKNDFTPKDLEFAKYFMSIHNNLNKGIKGRGPSRKDSAQRMISNTPISINYPGIMDNMHIAMTNMHMVGQDMRHMARSYSQESEGRVHEIFDSETSDMSSQSSISTPASNYEPFPNQGLAFGDRNIGWR